MTTNPQQLFEQSAAEIDNIFNKKIAPQLHSFEEERLTALNTRRGRWLKGALISAFIVAAFVWLFFYLGWSWLWALIPAALALLTVWIWATRATGDYVDRLRDTVMAAICDHLGDLHYQHDNIEGFPLQSFRDAKLIPSYKYTDLEDLLTGSHRGCSFALVEAELEEVVKTYHSSGSNRSRSTVFNGLLFRVDVPQPIKGKILIARDYGSWINKIGGFFRDGERVEIPHAEFEKKFEVYASEPQLALGVITPAFVHNFLALSDLFGSKKLRASFWEDEFLISADGVKSFLDDFSASMPIAELNALFHKIAQETRLVHRIIDQLHEPYGSDTARPAGSS